MRIVIIGLVVVAIMLAGGTAYLLRSYISTEEAKIASQTAKAPTIKILVAGADIPAGTVVNDKNTDWMDWPEGDIPEGFLVKNQNLNPLIDITADKHVARRGFTKGEPITMSRLYASNDPGFLRGSLEPGMRAVAVRSSAETGASGFILPGDKVDVILTHNMVSQLVEKGGGTPPGVGALEHTSETILEDLRVIAVDQKVSEFEGGAVLAKTVLLEMTPKQSEILNTARAMGTLTLVLRSAEEGEAAPRERFTTDIEVSPILSSIAGGGAPGGGEGEASIPLPTFSSTPPVEASPKITVYRGGQSTGGGGQAAGGN